MQRFYHKAVVFLRSTLFFWLTWVLFIFESAWIALSARFPMAFDEGYHVGIIKIFARQWSPLILKQPLGQAPFGALPRDPSILHHYLLSFPYRVFVHLGYNEYTTIVALRFINIAFFAVGLILFRKLLLKTQVSRAAVHAALLFFVLIPTVPQVAGQVNYDNLQFPLVALALLLAIRVTKEVRSKKIAVGYIMATLIVCLLGSLNKFTFLPILTAIVLYLLYILIELYTAHRSRFRKTAAKEWRALGAFKRRTLLTVLVLLSGIFVWFYGVNLVVYRNPVAQCHQVLSPARCSSYGPWARNYQLAQTKHAANANPLLFTLRWVAGMQYRLFFTINGATGPKLYTNHLPPVVTGVSAVAAIGGFGLFFKHRKRILKKDPALGIMMFAVTVYVISLWGRNYHDLLQLGSMVAINGRYFHPVLLPILVACIAGYQLELRKSPELKLAIFGVVLIAFMSGGGITGFVHYGDINWYWLHHDFIVRMNDIGKKIIAPFFLWRT